ncbi:PepSY domain-containing protein [Corynebacterium propinquum]|uniref:PepSY-associated TM helix domain-containing protein n=1 Tax=Corynebacterium propinquum TaxID=43769 RepID=UPI0025433D7E|nr:PepSY domain-containing protein [Corynebacterium propinquum]MDK4303530.1 PepSY domain-containing protein [Corynebacterium propinquum]
MTLRQDRPAQASTTMPAGAVDETSARNKRGARKPNALVALLRRLHFYAGMFIGPFLLIAAISGALYAVAPTAEKLVYQDVLTVTPPPGSEGVTNTISLEEQVTQAHEAFPDLDIAQVWPSSEPGETTRVLLIDETIDEAELRSVFVNPYTGAVVGDEPSYSGLGELPLRRWISHLHESMHLGPVGELYSELAASWLWFFALGGLVLWASRNKKVQQLFGFGNARTGKEAKNKGSGRRRLVNLHGVTGTWMLIGMLALSVTGITWSTYAGGNVNRTVEALQWRADPITTELSGESTEAADPHAEHAGHGGGAASESEARAWTPEEIAEQSDQVLATAREEGLTGSLRMYPGESVEHGWQASERWTEWRTTSDAISVDGETGEVIDRLPFSELPLFSKLTSWGIYLHMGIMFGLPLQILLLVTALAIAGLVVLGYLIWWKRRPTPGATAGISGPRTKLSTKQWIIVAVFLVAVGGFLPLFGISLAAMLLADVLLSKRAGHVGHAAHAGHETRRAAVDGARA